MASSTDSGGIFELVSGDGIPEEDEKRPTVGDVYLLAGEIGREFERLVDQYGAEGIKTVMPKVVRALETLERMVSISEKEEETISYLRDTIEQLENEKKQKAAEHLKFQKDVEAVDEESKELRLHVQSLQSENRKLSEALKEQELFDNFDKEKWLKENSAGLNNGYEEDVTKLSITISKLQRSLELSNKELNSKSAEFNEAKAQIDKLMSANKRILSDMKDKEILLLKMSEEKSNLQTELQLNRLETANLQKQISLLQNDRSDMSISNPNGTNNRSFEVDSDNDDSESPEGRPESKEPDKVDGKRGNKVSISDSLLEDSLSLEETIWERAINANNNFKGLPLSKDDIPLKHIFIEKATECSSDTPSYSGDSIEERPVQGPMPREPYDAPWKKNEEHGVRNFFRKILGSLMTEDDSFLPSQRKELSNSIGKT